ncbi:unnamed protein product [Ranitomeya imitator]|uniref:Uncharacterized protein n=1 Tax=Ranitomeya imitator TaxID=111125 RepID=A0ABN9L9X6_9NEOB|nr:unnamed protein product [Ranitomeya imitator]
MKAASITRILRLKSSRCNGSIMTHYLQRRHVPNTRQARFPSFCDIWINAFVRTRTDALDWTDVAQDSDRCMHSSAFKRRVHSKHQSFDQMDNGDWGYLGRNEMTDPVTLNVGATCTPPHSQH